jgi:serine/threonine protein kinase
MLPAVDDSSTLHKKLARERARRALFGGEPEPVTVGRYELRGRIGSGAMGVVYAAHDPKLDRPIAIKLLRSELATDASMRERMLREARALAKLEHANVVAVYDAGLHGERVFLAMELVDGETLSGWAKRESAPRIVAVMIGAAEGLAAAHRSGLTHRDFKPANVLVTSAGVAKVVDFGLVQERAPTNERLTDPDAVIGTPAYMAPEQLFGSVAGTRSDQYAFAVALYEALYGALPFRGSTLAEVVAAKRAGKTVPPPGRAGISRATARAIERALSLDARERHPSMDAMVAELRKRPWPRLPWWR